MSGRKTDWITGLPCFFFFLVDRPTLLFTPLAHSEGDRNARLAMSRLPPLALVYLSCLGCNGLALPWFLRYLCKLRNS